MSNKIDLLAKANDRVYNSYDRQLQQLDAQCKMCKKTTNFNVEGHKETKAME